MAIKTATSNKQQDNKIITHQKPMQLKMISLPPVIEAKLVPIGIIYPMRDIGGSSEEIQKR